jgi:hypothetical protein
MATAPFGLPFACGAILGGVIGCGVLLLPGTAPAPAAGAARAESDGAWAVIPTAAAAARGTAAEPQRSAAGGELVQGGLLATTAPARPAGEAREAAPGTHAPRNGAEERRGHRSGARTATVGKEATGRTAQAAVASVPNVGGKDAPAAQQNEIGQRQRPEGLLGLGGPVVAAIPALQSRHLWWKLPTP